MAVSKKGAKKAVVSAKSGESTRRRVSDLQRAEELRAKALRLERRHKNRLLVRVAPDVKLVVETAKKLKAISELAWVRAELALALEEASSRMLAEADRRAAEIEAESGQTFIPGTGPQAQEA